MSGTRMWELAAATRELLPQLNDAIELRQASAEEMVSTLRGWTDDLDTLLGGPVSQVEQPTARRAIQLLGFWVSSIERHIQTALGTEAKGMGLAQLPGVESALVTLGAIAQHPPRDTHYTYWLWNPGPQSLTFTGDPQERVFNVIVNHTQRLHQRTIEALRPVCRGDISFSDLASPEALRVATANMRELRDHFRSFMARADNGDWAMTPEFFMLRMRTYLTTYPIDGVFWGGVNATYLAEQAQVDFLVGTVHETYRHKVRERFRYMTREDTDAVQADMELPSIGAILLERLNLSEQDVMISSDEMLTARLLAQPAWLQRMTLAYVDLVTAAGQLSATHWSLIANYLMKPMQHLTPEQLDQLAVKPSTGVSGNGLEEAEMIRDMRRAHEVFSRLVAVTSSLRAAQSASE